MTFPITLRHPGRIDILLVLYTQFFPPSLLVPAEFDHPDRYIGRSSGWHAGSYLYSFPRTFIVRQPSRILPEPPLHPHMLCGMIDHAASILSNTLNHSHLLGLPSAILLCISAYFTYNFFFHPLARVPGPLSAHCGIPWFRVYATVTRTYAWGLQSMHLKYGAVVRLGPNFVSTTDSEAVRKLYAYGSPFHKTTFYTAFSKFKVFSDTYPAPWVGIEVEVVMAQKMTHRLHPVQS